MVSKAARLWGALFFGIISLTLPATAQESTYSADSLMAAFEKGSKASLKGAEIAFRGVVVENKNSKLVFRSSESNKVICDLSGSAARYNTPRVGGMVTVIGKVRGRGLLGNVTLDNCSLAPSAAPPVATQPAPEELATPLPDRILEKESTAASLPKESIAASLPKESPDRILEKKSTAASLPKQPKEPRKEEPRKEEFKKEEPRTEVETRSVQPVTLRNAIVNQETVSPGRVQPQDQTTSKSAEPRNGFPYRFYALLILGGAVAYAILSNLLAVAVTAIRYSRLPSSENTPEVRQAALELLLLKSKKKRKP